MGMVTFPEQEDVRMGLFHSVDPDEGWQEGLDSIGEVFGTRDGGETWHKFPLPNGLRNVYTIACA
jgi:photosystem II stability/assembly factor-like uncharacterized protein